MGKVEWYGHGDLFIDVASKRNYYNFIKYFFCFYLIFNVVWMTHGHKNEGKI